MSGASKDGGRLFGLVLLGVGIAGTLLAHASLHRWMASSDLATKLLSRSVETNGLAVALLFFATRALVFFVVPGLVLYLGVRVVGYITRRH